MASFFMNAASFVIEESLRKQVNHIYDDYYASGISAEDIN